MPIGRALFYEGIKDIGAQCGRSSGKTDVAGYCSWRYSQEVPNSENYIFEPLQKQAKEILWASKRIQTFGPEEWIESINNTEMRITFTNGSFIKLDGSDNVDALRGIKPKGLVIFDELKDHKKEFIDAMEPNRARYDAPALYLGTPPPIRNHYVDIMESLKANPRARHFTATSFDNIHNSRKFLENMRDNLIKKGELETWLREYEAKFVIGGKRSVYPWINGAKRHKFDDVCPKDLNKWIIYVTHDPASTSVFGVLFRLHNPHTKKSIVFDEIYEDRASMMTAREIHKAIQEKLYNRKINGRPIKELVKSVEYIYDEAAAWFMNEMQEVDKRIWLIPTNKADYGVEGYISLVKNYMNHDDENGEPMLSVTDEVPNFWSEHENYIKDEKGKIPKENDHLVNCLQYDLGNIGVDLKPLFDKVIPKEEKRFFTPEEELLPQESYKDMEGF